MNLQQLVEMDMGSAVDWLIENQYDFALVPKKPTEAMCEAFHQAQEEWDEGGVDSPDHQWNAMLKTYEKESKEGEV
ncbi:hypothetical protein TUM4637_40810 [Shewanella hafniensis]|uniref:hypothetical protein n=1 Tax=Shewanella hafniensis TaxID=365590 RepID=UPI001BC2DE7D|nr:hypothetical protein [Shewanella hafniensis]MCL1136857.1 hypothetical protein [Shewanella hafniensis]GIU39129.1 hypothetical protein TUM4637_40810 [Shewanella hafniensis]